MVAYFFYGKNRYGRSLLGYGRLLFSRSLIAIGRLLGYGRLFLLPKNGIVLSIFVPLITVNEYMPPF